VILTHPHYNHLQGLLAILDKFKVRQVIIPVLGVEALRQDQMREFLVQVRDKKIYLREWRGGEQWQWQKALYLESSNSGECLVTKLVYGDRSFLFTSDGAIPVNEKVDVAQIPNHGKDLAGPLPQVKYLVVSSKIIPPDEKIWSTKRDGHIRFVTNGQWLKVKTSK
jgi:beta-lactamase superfamily II metal-dependent hydrolase